MKYCITEYIKNKRSSLLATVLEDPIARSQTTAGKELLTPVPVL